ncbi:MULTISPECIES: sulfurtransferase TusA family protein [unclassified Bosea (in: a-proteobacteria)]|uniref:sulfurtransferase TusA family protein n=1 Tax=unclassified Bosea (in: a-proteobacteria) TaxID=2653178 RepID=UPI000A426008|nr:MULTISPECIES: sulfurtransferase TusA family protein [unclassified Bosea (in: a-proteobacteria)]
MRVRARRLLPRERCGAAMDVVAASESYDAGEMGCGELVMVLRTKLRAMPGQVLRVVARDPGASEDIPAWCRMTGHELARHEPETYSFWIRARANRS